MSRFKRALLSDDLSVTAFCFAATAFIRLISSVILTRLLYPEAYGLVAILSSIVFVIELVSDIGAVGFVIRTERGEEKAYLDTVWTLRLVRGCAIALILYLAAPLIARLYEAPALEEALQLFSAWFVLSGLESMSFALAIRHRKARIMTYCELVATFLTTLFVIGYSMIARDHTGIVYGMLLNRLMMTVMSYFFYPELRPSPRLDRAAAREMFNFSKFVLPSSIISVGLNLYDKLIFLKLFDLHLLGLYGLAGNIIGPVDGLTTKICRRILYGRTAHDYRTDAESLRVKYYRDNVVLFAMTMFMPAAMGGAAHSIVQLLYDSRYAFAGVVLQAFAIRSVLLALASQAENLLVASGSPRVILIGNLYRIAWLVPATLVGYYFWGFEGFLYGAVLDVLPALIYFFWLQHRKNLLILRYEALKLFCVAIVAVASFYLGGLGMHLIAAVRGA